MQAGPSIGTPTKHNGFGCPEALIGRGRNQGNPGTHVQHPKPIESRRAVCAVPRLVGLLLNPSTSTFIQTHSIYKNSHHESYSYIVIPN